MQPGCEPQGRRGGGMFASGVLDVAAALIFIYMILGLVCTTVTEWVAQMFRLRSTMLKEAIRGLLTSETSVHARDLAAEFYEHGLVKALTKNGGAPSYIPARTFSLALMDLLCGEPRATKEMTSVLQDLPEGGMKRTLLLLLQEADSDIAAFRNSIESWFDDAMDRVSGWYKKKTQFITAVVAVGVTVFANADSVAISRKLFLNPAVRERIAREASELKKSGDTASVLTPGERADLAELTGWSSEFRTFHAMEVAGEPRSAAEREAARLDDSFPGWALATGLLWPWLWTVLPGHLAGWALTAVAASLGAPFWFDVLNRFMNFRAAGIPPNERRAD